MASNPLKIRIWVLLAIGFALIEFPGVFFINRTHPHILGFPFLYGFVLLVWVYLCAVFYYAYRRRWGDGPKND